MLASRYLKETKKPASTRDCEGSTGEQASQTRTQWPARALGVTESGGRTSGRTAELSQEPCQTKTRANGAGESLSLPRGNLRFLARWQMSPTPLASPARAA